MKNSLPIGYHSRPASMDDLKAAVDMFNASARQMIGVDKFVLEVTSIEWKSPGFNLDIDTLIIFSETGQVAGYYEVWDLKPHISTKCWGSVHPDHTNRGIGSYLLEWGEERARQAIHKASAETRVTMSCLAMSLNQVALDLFEKAGMQRARHFYRMVIDLDNPPPQPQWPEGIEVRTMVVDQDEWKLTNAAVEVFRDHWGYVERSVEDEHERWMHEMKNNQDFDPSLYFLAWDGNQIAGVSLCWKHAHDDHDMGWVEVLGVRRPWRKHGLGLALLLHSFGEIYRQGKVRAGLGVDAESLTGALRLYEKAGLRSDPNRTFIAYEKELRPGVDLRTRQIDQE